MSQIENAKIMDRYYEQRALSSIAETPFFKIGEVVWGTGFVGDDGSGNPIVLEIPTNVTDIEGEFHRNEPTLSYSNGAITVKATIAVAELPSESNVEFSALYVLDQAGGIVAIFAVTPTWMNSRRSLSIDGVLEIGSLVA
jgi:hypothetical protein